MQKYVIDLKKTRYITKNPLILFYIKKKLHREHCNSFEN